VNDSASWPVGKITWTDLTVPNADVVRDFYSAVVGWRAEPVDMGGYADYGMLPPDAQGAAAGICHARGVNEGIPGQWLPYIHVADLDESLRRCRELGGEILHGPRDMGSFGQFCVIRDPAGACAGLMGPPRPKTP